MTKPTLAIFHWAFVIDLLSLQFLLAPLRVSIVIPSEAKNLYDHWQRMLSVLEILRRAARDSE
jgi:hypothetical protein